VSEAADRSLTQAAARAVSAAAFMGDNRAIGGSGTEKPIPMLPRDPRVRIRHSRFKVLLGWVPDLKMVLIALDNG
jgi:hypothetical protein